MELLIGLVLGFLIGYLCRPTNHVPPARYDYCKPAPLGPPDDSWVEDSTRTRSALAGPVVSLAFALIAQFVVRWLGIAFGIVRSRPVAAVPAEVPGVLPGPLAVRHNVASLVDGNSREICKLCYHVNAVGFNVPDDVWARVVPPHVRDRVVCLSCFTRLADEKLVEWDRQVEFWPVSMAKHLSPL